MARTPTSSAGNEARASAPPRARGFTLLELLVVLAILVAATAIVLPSLGGRSGMELEAAARSLASGLRQARSESITRRRSTALLVDVENRRYGLLEGRARRALPSGIDIGLISAKQEPNAIRFYPDGSSTGGRITLAHRDRGYIVDVDWFTGKVAVWEVSGIDKTGRLAAPRP